MPAVTPSHQLMWTGLNSACPACCPEIMKIPRPGQQVDAFRPALLLQALGIRAEQVTGRRLRALPRGRGMSACAARECHACLPGCLLPLSTLFPRPQTRLGAAAQDNDWNGGIPGAGPVKINRMLAQFPEITTPKQARLQQGWAVCACRRPAASA